MNKNISERIIEIGDKEYTLFLNREGVVGWEKASNFQTRIMRFQELAQQIRDNDNYMVANDANPFEIAEDKDPMEKEYEEALNDMRDVIAKFLWVALYTHHKLKVDEAKELYDKAEEEYGYEQMFQLVLEMLEDANTDKVTNRKNLKALKSTKRR